MNSFALAYCCCFSQIWSIIYDSGETCCFSQWADVYLSYESKNFLGRLCLSVLVALSNTDVKATMVFMKCFHQHLKRWLEMDLELPKVKLISSLSSDEISSSYSTKDQIRIRLRFLRGPHIWHREFFFFSYKRQTWLVK